MKNCLFAYGSLRAALVPPEVNGLVRHCRPVGQARVRGRLYDLIDFPGLILDPTAEEVVGEVYELPDDETVLAGIDAYEEYSPENPAAGLFVRVQHSVLLSDGKQLTCWIYVLKQDPGAVPLVVGGDYVAWRAGQAEPGS